MRKITLFALGIASLLFLTTGCRLDDSPLPSEVDARGRIVSAELQHDWSVAEVDSLILSIDPLLFLFVKGQYPVRVYNVIYETISFDGTTTIASGVSCIPYTDSTKSFPIASYQHGTVMKKTNVATRGQAQIELGIIFASEGYTGCLPDYLGLGDGPGFHPYIHAKSEATAVTDMIRATRNLMAREDVAWNEQLFLYGYSQGGHATMAAHRYIQKNLRDEFTVTASAPMSGPYDASGVQEAVITGFDPYPTPGYLPFILYSYNMVYNLVPDVNDLFQYPYDSIIPPMMNGDFSVGELNVISNPIPRLMLKDSVMAAYEADPDHPLKVALRDNDLYDWVPETPVRMYYCAGDDQVSFRNSLVAYDKFIEAGASPDIVSLEEPNPTADHVGCAQPCFLSAKVWFDSMKKE